MSNYNFYFIQSGTDFHPKQSGTDIPPKQSGTDIPPNPSDYVSDSDLPKPSDELFSYKKYERTTSRAGSMGSGHSSVGSTRKSYAE